MEYDEVSGQSMIKRRFLHAELSSFACRKRLFIMGYKRI